MTNLSPAAQAVKDAALAMYSDCNVRKLAWPLDMPVVAAALRAAADHINHDWSAFNCVDALCEIAAELDGTLPTSESD